MLTDSEGAPVRFANLLLLGEQGGLFDEKGSQVRVGVEGGALVHGSS
jgi:hypothetical protein